MVKYPQIVVLAADLEAWGVSALFCIFFFRGRWGGQVCWDFVPEPGGGRASFLTSVLVSEHISQNVQKKRFENLKNQVVLFLFFLLQNEIWKKERKDERADSHMYCEASHLCRCFTPFK